MSELTCPACKGKEDGHVTHNSLITTQLHIAHILHRVPCVWAQVEENAKNVTAQAKY